MIGLLIRLQKRLSSGHAKKVIVEVVAEVMLGLLACITAVAHRVFKNEFSATTPRHSEVSAQFLRLGQQDVVR